MDALTVQHDRITSRLAPVRRGTRMAVSAGAIAAITLIAILWQTRWGTVPDTSWLITECERVLAGGRLYVDVYEVNPPFSVWLYLPAVAVAQAIGMAPEIIVHALTYAAALWGLLLAGAVLRRADFPETPALLALAPIVYALLVLYPGNAFSQREHIGMALFLPMLVLMAWRARLDGSTRPGIGIALVAGLSGSVLLLVKPHYAVMIIVPTLLTCWRHRSLRPIVAVEHWAIGAICTAYLAAVLLIHPEFLRDIYPALADTYLRVRRVDAVVSLYGASAGVLALLVWLLWPRARIPELASVAALSAASALIPLVWQGKGWPYHAYPAFFCATFALTCLHAGALSANGEATPFRFPLFAKLSSVLVATGILVSFPPFWPSQKPNADTIAAIQAATDRPSIALIGPDIASGHPLTRMVAGRWVSVHASDWLGVTAQHLAAISVRPGDEADVEHYADMLDAFGRNKRDELLTHRPDLIVIQQDQDFWLDLLRQRYGLAEIMTGYRLLAEDAAVKVYLGGDIDAKQVR